MKSRLASSLKMVVTSESCFGRWRKEISGYIYMRRESFSAGDILVAQGL